MRISDWSSDVCSSDLKGLQIREELLGKEKIDTALWGADAFNQPMQQLATEYCWGEIWSRPGLPRKTRSLLNIAMLSALNRATELAIHVRAALKNDCTDRKRVVAGQGGSVRADLRGARINKKK